MAAPAAATTPTKATNDAEKAPPTPQDLAKVPPAPPRHMPSCAPTTSEDGLLQFGRPDGKAGVEGQSLQDAFKRFRKERRRTKKRESRRRGEPSARSSPSPGT